MLSQMSQDPNERELLEDRRKAFLDYNTNMQGAREEGKQEGLQEGKLEILLVQAASRYGQLPSWAIDKLQQCSSENLTFLSQSIFNADTLNGWIDGLEKQSNTK